jgi:hypothetical protein
MSTREQLLEKCGLPNYNKTSHCFSDSTYHTCCMLGPEARKYFDNSGNPIGIARYGKKSDELPSNLQYLKIDHNFNKSLKELKLEIDDRFRGTINNLPSGLQKLVFGYNFNKLVNNHQTYYILNLEIVLNNQ